MTEKNPVGAAFIQPKKDSESDKKNTNNFAAVFINTAQEEKNKTDTNIFRFAGIKPTQEKSNDFAAAFIQSAPKENDGLDNNPFRFAGIKPAQKKSNDFAAAFINPKIKNRRHGNDGDFCRNDFKENVTATVDAINRLPGKTIADVFNFTADYSKKGIICLAGCGSGTGKNGTGMTFFTGKNGVTIWHCFGCGLSTNNIGAIKLSQRVGDLRGREFIDFLIEVADRLNIRHDLQSDHIASPKVKRLHDLPPPPPIKDIKPIVKPVEIHDYSEQYKKWQENLYDFITRLPCNQHYRKLYARDDYQDLICWRGLSYRTLQSFGCGFNPRHHPIASAYSLPAMIVPYDETHYLARYTDTKCNDAPDWFIDRYKKVHSPGAKSIFNLNRALKSAAPVVFLLEGEINVMSLYQIMTGEEIAAVAIGGNSLTESQISILADIADSGRHLNFIVMFDSDIGEEKRRRIEDKANKTVEILQDIGHFATAKFLPNPKDSIADVNDWLQSIDCTNNLPPIIRNFIAESTIDTKGNGNER